MDSGHSLLKNVGGYGQLVLISEGVYEGSAWHLIVYAPCIAGEGRGLQNGIDLRNPVMR